MAKYDAFWEKFAENVMTHFVWPAEWAGHIRAAPKASIDNPKWWVEGIAPILEHDDVYQLYYKGGKRKAKACWGHVCRELASHNFAEQEAPEPFTQKTALEFIEAAGYRKAGASQQNAATEPKLATTSKVNVAMPDTKKQRIHDSESARAAAQSAPSSASAKAKAASGLESKV